MSWTPQSDQTPPMTATRREIIDWLARMVEGGIDCPCCSRRVKVYPNRKISVTTARVLKAMYKRGGISGTDWVHIPTICNDLRIGSRGDETRAREWKLIEKQPGRRADGGPSTGWWRLTPTGVSFVQGRIPVTKYARVFNNEVMEFHGPQVTIDECLPFDYDENEG